MNSPDHPHPPSAATTCTISAVSYAGLSVTTNDGQSATLAVIDGTGRVIASGLEIEQAAWKAAVLAYRNFLMGEGHLRVLAPPVQQGG